MPGLKDRINRTLTARFGYHLEKGAPGEAGRVLDRRLAELSKRFEKREAEMQERLRITRRRAAQAERRANAAEYHREQLALGSRPRERGSKPQFDPGPATAEIVDAVGSFTTADGAAVTALVDAARHVVRWEIGGAFVDCAADGGGAAQALARALVEAGDTTRQVVVINAHGAEPGTGERLTGLMTAAGYPADNVRHIVGDGGSEVWNDAPESIAVCRIEIGTYRDADVALHRLWDRIVQNGLLVLDGFGSTDAADRVLSGLLDHATEPLFFSRAGTARVAVKTSP